MHIVSSYRRDDAYELDQKGLVVSTEVLKQKSTKL